MIATSNASAANFSNLRSFFIQIQSKNWFLFSKLFQDIILVRSKKLFLFGGNFITFSKEFIQALIRYYYSAKNPKSTLNRSCFQFYRQLQQKLKNLYLSLLKILKKINKNFWQNLMKNFIFNQNKCFHFLNYW